LRGWVMWMQGVYPLQGNCALDSSLWQQWTDWNPPPLSAALLPGPVQSWRTCPLVILSPCFSSRHRTADLQCACRSCVSTLSTSMLFGPNVLVIII
jgi:hypothetical protein